MRHFRNSIFFLSLLVTMAGPGRGQTNPGSITGVVKDARDTPIPGVAVQAQNAETGAKGQAVTNDAGVFRIEALAPGSYNLQAELPGFTRFSRSSIGLQGGQTSTVDITLQVSTPGDGTDPQNPTRKEEIVVTARRIEEEAQEVPIPLSVVNGNLIENAGAFNVNRLKELLPTVQFFSSNPRNSAINIRGLGAPFGLTNDGIEPGVGFYVDGVYYARPASATMDFLDVERIEVLRGPQGTLFGKNTTAGAVHITTRKPSFTPGTNFELSYGSYGFLQAKGSLTGPLTSKLAGRISFSGTQRDGLFNNVKTQDDVNDLNNLGLRGQLLFLATSNLVISGAVDYTRQRPEGYTQAVAGVTPTLRNPNRQYPQIAADLGYAPPSFNAFDRLTDVDTPLRSNQTLGGASVTLDWNIGPGVLTAITSWRYWNWDPSNDRDFIGLPVTSVSAAPSTQRQWSQEIRYAGKVSPSLNLVVGAFAFRQDLNSDPDFKQEQGSAAARFLLAPTPGAATPGLLDGYGQNQSVDFKNTSTAVFGQLEWFATSRLRFLPGLRLNYDKKNVDFNQVVYGGLQTTDPALIALQRSVLAPQAYVADVDDTNLSGQLSVAYKVAENVDSYVTYATGFKSVGLNLNGLPTDELGRPILSAATVKPEEVKHVEFGIKTRPFARVTANFTFFNTDIKDFQAQVVNADVGVLRGYLANAEKVRVRGIEFDGNIKVNEDLTFYGAAAFNDGRYISFPDAPPPLEDTGGPQVKDISGSSLPGISKWALSFGGEYTIPRNLISRPGKFFISADGSYRSAFSSSPSASRYLVVSGYPLLNARIGFRWNDGWGISAWSRNVLDHEYYEFLSAAPGNSGLYVGQPGDQRTFGVTLQRAF
jgi:iron complex outermembrane receptor protein